MTATTPTTASVHDHVDVDARPAWTCATRDLRRTIAAVRRVVNADTTHPVLATILFTAVQNQVSLVGTDLVTAARVPLVAEVAHAGAFAMQAKLLADVVKQIPDATVTMQLDDDGHTVHLRYGRSSVSFDGVAARDYPRVPVPPADAVPLAIVGGAALRTALGQVVVAVARKDDRDARPVLGNVLWALAGDRLHLVATDAYRLAAKTLALPTPVRGEHALLFPQEAIDLAVRVLADEACEILPFGNDLLALRTPTIEIVTRAYDSPYVHWQRAIHPSYPAQAQISRAALATALKQAAVFATRNGSRVRLDLQPPAGCDLTVVAPGVGKHTTSFEATVGGETAAIWLDAAFFMDAVATFGGEQLVVHLAPGDGGSVLLRTVGDTSHDHMIMGVNLGV